jgi:6-phosphogluconolactonase
MTTAPATGEIRVLPDGEALRRAAADEILRSCQEVLRARKAFTIALAGGKTPRGLYQLLGGEGDTTYRLKMPWPQVHFFWTDERIVPADHPDSNYGMARETFLQKINATRKQVHRIRTEGMTPPQSAVDYERELKAFFGDHLMLRHNVPRFDVVLLGLGADGHAAGLFPGWDVSRALRPLVVAPRTNEPAKMRISMTPLVINMAANVIFMVAGKEKAAMLRTVIEGQPKQPEVLSAQAIRPSEGRLLWLVDKEAASELA